MDWYVSVLKDYTKFDGRAHRTEFWMFSLINFLIMILLAVVEIFIGTAGTLGTIYALGVLLPNLAVSVRRLHDTGRSGWWLLITLIPLVGFIVFIVFAALDGQPGDNEYGPNPWGV